MCDRRCVNAIVHEARLATTTLSLSLTKNQSRREVSVPEDFGATLITAAAPFAVCYVVRAASPSGRALTLGAPQSNVFDKKIRDETAFFSANQKLRRWPSFPPSPRSAQKRQEELQEKRRQKASGRAEDAICIGGHITPLTETRAHRTRRHHACVCVSYSRAKRRGVETVRSGGGTGKRRESCVWCVCD